MKYKFNKSKLSELRDALKNAFEMSEFSSTDTENIQIIN